MSDFEFIFVLYGLLLGLALAELLAGLGNALEAKFASDAGERRFVIGWLSPLLAVFVMLDLLSFWVFAWRVREQITVSAAALLAVMGFASAYYLAARLVFPREPQHFADLDTHFLRVKAPIMAMLIVLVGLQWLYLFSIPGSGGGVLSPLTIVMTLVLVALMAGVALVRSKPVCGGLLVAMIARYLWVYAIR